MFHSIVLVSVVWAAYVRAQSQEWGQCTCILKTVVRLNSIRRWNWLDWGDDLCFWVRCLYRMSCAELYIGPFARF